MKTVVMLEIDHDDNLDLDTLLPALSPIMGTVQNGLARGIAGGSVGPSSLGLTIPVERISYDVQCFDTPVTVRIQAIWPGRDSFEGAVAAAQRDSVDEVRHDGSPESSE